MRFRLILSAFLLIPAFSFAQAERNGDQQTPTTDDIPTINIEENSNLSYDEQLLVRKSGDGIYSTGNDPFIVAPITTFGLFRFRPRGMNNYELFVNGAQIENIERGYTTTVQFGNLNDVFHFPASVYGLMPSPYTYGGLTGSRYFEATAADQRKGNTISYTLNQRSYKNRVMATHNSGLMNNGWAYSLSASRKWAEQIFRPGTFYDGYAAYGAVSKVIGKSQFNLTAYAAPTIRGGYRMTTDEAYELDKDNLYNPTWGYQKGQVRNSRITNVFQPVAIASYTLKPSDRTRWNTALGYEFGKYRSSTIDDYNASSSAPDYYRYLPSYYLNFDPPQPSLANAVKTHLLANPGQLQIDWDGIYNANYTNTETVKNVGGIAGNDYTGRRSIYVLSDYVDDMKKINLNTNAEHNLNEHINLYGGAKFISQDDRLYKQLTDLLGGDYFVNYNQFANQKNPGSPTAVQNNLNNPNQVIKKGDIYGYDIKINVKNANVWGQSVFTFTNFDFFAAAILEYTSFYREGLMKNGLFPDHSFGKSETHDFLTYKGKGGITYKIDRKNFLYLNADYSQEAPSVYNTYISPTTRDYTIGNPVPIKSKTVEGGYIFKSAKLNARVTGYLTDFSNATSILRFYNDDPSIQSFVNYVMNGVGMRTTGAELTAVYKITHSWSVSILASEGRAFYTNSPMVSVYQDNIPGITSVAHKVYIKNYYIANGPQSVYSLGLQYRPANRWHVRVNLNYIDNNYVSINPDRRTQLALDLVQPGSAQWNQVVDQEKLPAAYTVDLALGKTFEVNKYVKRAPHRMQLVMNGGIGNLLNNKNIKTQGQEQLRYDYSYRNPNKFPNRYEYSYGINFYAYVALRF